MFNRVQLASSEVRGVVRENHSTRQQLHGYLMDRPTNKTQHKKKDGFVLHFVTLMEGLDKQEGIPVILPMPAC